MDVSIVSSPSPSPYQKGEQNLKNNKKLGEEFFVKTRGNPKVGIFLGNVLNNVLIVKTCLS